MKGAAPSGMAALVAASQASQATPARCKLVSLCRTAVRPPLPSLHE